MEKLMKAKKKLGRPNTGMVRINTYMSKRAWESIQTISQGYGVPAAELLRRWVDEKIDEMKKR
jgi:hypothetical protein